MFTSTVLNGLNKRAIAVDRMHVMFLEEAELDGTRITNVHFTNGKWVTAAHPLEEVRAMLSESGRQADMDEEETKEEARKLKRWKELAKARREAQIEVEEQLRKIGPKLKAKGYSSETLPDGSGRMVINFEPEENEETSTS